MNLNKIFIIGNLTRDPELRTTPNGHSVAQFGVATNRYWKDQNGQRQSEVEFHNVVVWGNLAKIAKDYLSKGKLVLIEGRIKTRTWEDQNGQKRSRTEIIGESLQLGPIRGDSQKPQEDNSNDDKVDDLPVVDSDEINSADDLPF